jgi:hypothetical protein
MSIKTNALKGGKSDSKIITKFKFVTIFRGSVVGMVTSYVLDGPGIESL